MITIETKQIKCYNETEKAELSFVMLQSLALESYRMQKKQQRFNRYKAVKYKYFKNANNRLEKRKAQKLVDIEMANFDNEVRKYIKNNIFMTDSFLDQMPQKTYDLMDRGTEFIDKLFIVENEG
jgi:hypothetical protein